MANMSIDQILDELSVGGLSDDVKRRLSVETREEVRDLSFLEILKLARKETSVSKVLAFLLNPANDSGNPMFLRLLFERCGVSNIYDFSGTKVDTEVCTSKNKYIDILAVSEDRFMLLIENKIWSSEHGDQTVSYYDYCEKKYGGCADRIYVYLKPYKNSSDSPKANTECGENLYNELFYDDIIDILKEVASSDGHRHNYKVIAEQFLSYCRSYLGKESVMGKMSEMCGAYVDNMEKFKVVEKNLGEYRKSYKDWIKEIKENVRSLLDNYVKKNECKYASDIDNGDDYYYARLYNKETNEKAEDSRKYYFYSEIHFCGNMENQDDTRVELQATVKLESGRDFEKIKTANANVPDCYKKGRENDIDLCAESRKRTSYVVYDITQIKFDDLIKSGGDTDEIGERIFSEFIKYREKDAEEIFKAFKDGYESAK